MTPNDYDLYLEQQAGKPASALPLANRPAPTSEQVQVASAIGFIESAQAEVAKARRALVLAGDDPSGVDRVNSELDRELAWLRG